MLTLHATSLADTHAIAAALAAVVRSGDVIVLAGEMGSGKTAFAQGFGAALGVDEPITSPTFNLVHNHRAGKLTLLHQEDLGESPPGLVRATVEIRRSGHQCGAESACSRQKSARENCRLD